MACGNADLFTAVAFCNAAFCDIAYGTSGMESAVRVRNTSVAVLQPKNNKTGISIYIDVY